MARARIPLIVLGPDGRPLAGASAVIRTLAGADATVYAARTGSSTISNPQVSDSVGRVAGWVDRGAYEARFTASGMDPYTEPFEAAPAGASTVDGDWIGDAAVTARTIAAGALEALGVLPIGGMAPWPIAGDPPLPWLLCDGRELARSSYPTLTNRIKDTPGCQGNGTSTIRLPDTLGRAIVGPDSGKGRTTALAALGDVAGLAAIALTAAQNGPHSHGVNDPGHGHNLYDPGHSHGHGLYATARGGGGGSVLQPNMTPDSAVFGNPILGAINAAGTGMGVYASASGLSIVSAGSGDAHPNVQPSIALPWMIRAL